MLTYEQALTCLLKSTPSPRMAVVRLTDALGLVLARSIRAGCDLPQFDNSAVDGYAIHLPASEARLRSAKTREASGAQHIPHTTNGHAAHVAFHVIGNAEAGRPFRTLLRQGEAVRIFTGAQVPRGVDAVVMQEDTKRLGDRLFVERWPKPGQHIRRRGEDLRQGTRILEAGTLLRPQELGLLAAVGVAKVPVYPRPTVAILTTGDELASPGTRWKPGQIYESNGPLLHALIQQAGARVVDLGTARDAIDALIQKIRRGLAGDLLVISGGVSVGEKDVVRKAAQCCGVHQVFWRVNIKPGMPLFVGQRRRTLVFGLPGNPASVFVTFEEFVKPALYRLMGREWRDPYTEPAVLIENLTISHTRRTHFIRVRCSQHSQLVAEPLDGQGSHRLRSLVEADGWLRMNAEQGPWSAGARVLVRPACAASTALPASSACLPCLPLRGSRQASRGRARQATDKPEAA